MLYGSAHVQGFYTVPEDSWNQLADGCDAIWDLGLPVLKLYCTSAYRGNYPLQRWSSWPLSMAQLAATTEFASQLSRPWKQIVLTCFTFANNPGGLVTNWFRLYESAAALEAERREFYDLTSYLLTAYAGTGKVFVLQPWEGDWIWSDDTVFDNASRMESQIVENYAAWLNARARGVREAVRDTPHEGVSVLSAIEVNRVLDSTLNPARRRIVRDLVGRVHYDCVSYSAYDSLTDLIYSGYWGDSFDDWMAKSSVFFPRAVRIIRANFPGPVQIGEFGFPELTAPPGYDVGAMIRHVAAMAEAEGVERLIYWQAFDNDTRGYFLRRMYGLLSVAGETMRDLAA